MKLAYSTNAFKRYSLTEAIEKIADIGYQAVEIMCDVPHAYPPHINDESANEIIKALKRRNLKISNLNAFTLSALGDVYQPSWIEKDLKKREQRIQHTINCIQLAKRLGAETISTEAGGSASSPNLKSESYLSIFIQGIREVAQVAEAYGVKILVEPEPGTLIETSDEFLNFVRQVGSEMVKLNFDVGHFFCVREDPSDLVYKLRDYIGHFHLEDISASRIHNHLIPGEGMIDFKRIFAAMQDIGYRGSITVELYPYQENPVEAGEKALRYLEPLLP